jgi:ribonuclease D
MSFAAGSSEPSLISTPGALRQLVETLSREPIIAVDTESNSLFAYREQVCLIQFSTPRDDFLVDPLALEDLSRLAPIFADPRIEKVFHAAEYDLLCLKRDFGFDCAGLFDTMVAASTLGRNEVGLGHLLEAEFGVQMDKQFQRANWGQRPLPASLLAYARLDTHYLLRLRHRLKTQLEAIGRWTLAAEEFQRICLACSRNHAGPSRSANEMCWRISGAMDLSPQQAAVLMELCRYRDMAASAHNRPLFKVIGDATLLAIASACPVNYDQLKKLPGMSQGQLRRHSRGLLQAVQRGLQAPPAYPARAPRPDEQFLARLESLRQWRKETANTLGVKSDVILSREVMFAIAEGNPQGPGDLAALMADLPWRLEQFGEQILEAIARAPESKAR